MKNKQNNPLKKSLWFEFNQYLQAFETWKIESVKHGDRIRFVVSLDDYTSGYWIENSNEGEVGYGNVVYNSSNAQRYFDRVMQEIAVAKLNHRSPRLII